MTDTKDRLYDLLPAVYRKRDVEQGRPLQALLRVIAEQVGVVEDDIDRLYENWFIETCEDWVVPYIGDLVGYRPVHEAGEPGKVTSARARQRNKILIPRREVANTIRYRRRKGTLALLELLARDVADWPARAVEFYKLLGWTQALNHQRLQRGRTVDLRQGDALHRLDGPFDELAHTVDVRRINSRRTRGRHNIPSVGLFVWRLRSYSVTRTTAYCREDVGQHCYTFSVLGNDTPLFTRPMPEAEPTDIAGELNLPVPIRRHAFEDSLSDYYGRQKSLRIWEGDPPQEPLEPIEPERILAADLSDWQYRPPRDKVAVDPLLGRIVFPPANLPEGVTVSYHYGFSADLGGGEYDRPLSQPQEHVVYRVGPDAEFKSISAALNKWEKERGDDDDSSAEDVPAALQNAVVEIVDSGAYVERVERDAIRLEAHHSLQLRAADRTRPVIRLLDWETGRPDSLTVNMEPGAHFTLDGLLVAGRGLRVQRWIPETEASSQEEEYENEEEPSQDLPTGPQKRSGVHIRHSTLVPGWNIGPDCEPQQPAEPSLVAHDIPVCITIEHSIVGSIQVQLDQVDADPIKIRMSDSVLDATSSEREAVGAPGRPLAHAVLTIARSTVFGQIQAHAIDLAENSIFMGLIKVARRQRGCMRFCYVTPHSRTPRRYHCQPDLVEKPIKTRFAGNELSEKQKEQRDRELARERLRVRPKFNSVRYGMPTYCQLAHACAEEIRRGADDEAEMGVFHDLYQPQRTANLRARLNEYTPAGAEAGIIFAT